MSVDFLKKDYEDLKNLFLKEGLINNNEKRELLDKLRRIHRICFSLALWDHNLSKTPVHGRVFLKEIRSDVIQTMPLILRGFKKPSYMLLRGTIENCLKYVYFIDHPIEFGWLGKKSKYFPIMDDLYNYMGSHPKLEKVLEKKDIVSIFKQKYRELSMLVHGRDIAHMQLVKSLSNIQRDDETIRNFESEITIIGNWVNLIIGQINMEKFNKFSQFSQDVILKGMDRATRRLFHGI